MLELKKLIREVPDYPKPGILFYDLTTVLKDKKGFHAMVDSLCTHYSGAQVDIVVGIEARGFIFAPALAYSLGAGFCSCAQAEETAGEDRAGNLRFGIRHGHIGDSPGCRAAGSARNHM